MSRLFGTDGVRGRVSGYFAAGFLIGNITGPLIGSALVGFGLRMPFVVYAVALIVASAVVATQLRADDGGERSGTPAGQRPRPDGRRLPDAMRTAVRIA